MLDVLAPMIAIGVLASMFIWIPAHDASHDRAQSLISGRTREERALDVASMDAELDWEEVV